jgi:hypothetical protein
MELKWEDVLETKVFQGKDFEGKKNRRVREGVCKLLGFRFVAAYDNFLEWISSYFKIFVILKKGRKTTVMCALILDE